MSEATYHWVDLAVKVLGLGGTAFAAILGVQTFMNTERWKRAEFVSREMKEYLANPRVQNALSMIDWSIRRLPLLPPSAPNGGSVVVDRAMGTRALTPHTVIDPTDGVTGDREATSATDRVVRFTPEQAAIRDAFDAFLDGLERFGSAVESRLCTVAELRPYLAYWIDDIAEDTGDDADRAWTAALLTYIDVYRYAGVQNLFAGFGRDIRPNGALYRHYIAEMQDRGLAAKLERALTLR